MQAASTALTAAIEAAGRKPVQRSRVDWDHDGTFAGTYDDVSLQVESVTVDQSLTTDLPAAAKLLTGYASTEATVVLGAGTAGDPVEHAAWMYSPYNEQSPLAGKDRLGAPVTLELGFDPGTGTELLPAFRGQVRDIRVSSGSRAATLSCLDNRERLSRQVTFPIIVANDFGQVRPGLTGEWLIDYALRACGFYATPPVRAQAVLSATLHGSVWPEVGTVTYAQNFRTGVVGGFAPGRFATGWHQETDGGFTIDYDLASPLSTNDGSTVFVETWVRPNEAASLWFLATAAQVIGDLPVIECAVNAVTGQLALSVQRSQNTFTHVTVPGPAISRDQWHYLGVAVAFAADGVTVRWRVDGVTTTQVVATPSVTDAAPLTRSSLGSVFVRDPQPAFEAYQVTSEAYTGGMWNDAFEPSAFLDPSLNPLTGVAATSSRAASALIQDLAAAEFGLGLLDETGAFHFRNRNWRDRPASATVQRTLTSSTSIKELGSSESIDTVRNRVIIRAQPVSLAVLGPIWSAAEVYRVPASSSRQLWADFDGAVYKIDKTVTFSPPGGQLGSGYRAATVADGTGDLVTNLTFTVVPFLDSALVTITNPNPFDVWLVQPEGYEEAGRPALSLWGQLVRTEAAEMDNGTPTSSRLVVEASDAASIGRYGEQLLDLPANPWRQDASGLGQLAADLLGYLKDPKPVLTNLSVVADPRLQLCDRVLIRDPAGLVFQGQFHLTGINTSFDGGGLSQQISARAVVWGAVPNEWDVDFWDYMQWEAGAGTPYTNPIPMSDAEFDAYLLES